MKTMMTTFALAALLALAGCKKKETPPAPAPAPAGSAAGSGSANAMAGSGSGSGSGSAAAAAAEVPTEEDFEGQASKDIDENNVDSKVSAIEKDLGQ